MKNKDINDVSVRSSVIEKDFFSSSNPKYNKKIKEDCIYSSNYNKTGFYEIKKYKIEREWDFSDSKNDTSNDKRNNNKPLQRDNTIRIIVDETHGVKHFPDPDNEPITFHVNEQDQLKLCKKRTEKPLKTNKIDMLKMILEKVF